MRKRLVVMAYYMLLKYFSFGKITHLFFYSKKQKQLGGYNKVKGKEYTEMRRIGKGFSNFGDAKIVGCGGYGDIEFVINR